MWNLTEKLIWKEVTLIDLEGQKYIAYDASVPNMSMYAKNHFSVIADFSVWISQKPLIVLQSFFDAVAGDFRFQMHLRMLWYDK